MQSQLRDCLSKLRIDPFALGQFTRFFSSPLSGEREINMIAKLLKQFIQEEEGQGISEYACVLAFTCLLIATVFGFSQGSLSFAISQSANSMITQLDRLNVATKNAT